MSDSSDAIAGLITLPYPHPREGIKSVASGAERTHGGRFMYRTLPVHPRPGACPIDAPVKLHPVSIGFIPVETRPNKIVFDESIRPGSAVTADGQIIEEVVFFDDSEFGLFVTDPIGGGILAGRQVFFDV